MSTFEFLFSLFGLLLGFSIAEIAGGFSRAYDRRKVAPIGWLAPLLATLLIVDLLLFWYGAWFQRDMELKFWLVLVAAVIGLLYYFAATQVFPREASQILPSDHVMGHRKPIMAAVLAANLIMFMPQYITLFITNGVEPLFMWNFWTTAVYCLLLVGVAFVPGKRWVGFLIAAALGLLLGTTWTVNY